MLKFVAMKKQGSILVVDDNVNISASLRLLLGGSFERVAVLPSPKRMLSVVAEEKADVVLLDMNFVARINSDTGKALLASEVHRNSLRADRKMVSVDMGSITESLFESELFGHVKGAFTGAQSDKSACQGGLRR